MKNNFRFIFPRLIAATAIVGLASMILITIFKLLFGILIVGGLVVALRRMSRRANHAIGARRYGQFSDSGVVPVMNTNQWNGSVTGNAHTYQKQTIVPIN